MQSNSRVKFSRMLLYDIGNNSVLCGRIVRPIFMQRRSETAVDRANAVRWLSEIWIPESKCERESLVAHAVP